MTLTPIQSAIAAIKSAPRINGGRIHWKADPSVMAKIALAIIVATNQAEAIKAITEATGVQEWTLRHFIRGNDAAGAKCSYITDILSSHGLAPYTFDRRTAAGRAASASKTEAPAATKPITLATTNKGEVIVAEAPTQLTAPTVMAAKPGEFATKSDATRCAFDAQTNDILVITTTRIRYGTPEWCAKMVEINRKPKA